MHCDPLYFQLMLHLSGCKAIVSQRVSIFGDKIFEEVIQLVIRVVPNPT
jgi:hypothetical protein